MSLATKTLQMLQDKKVFANIYDDSHDTNIVGFVRKFNDEFLLLDSYNTDGYYDGIVIFRRGFISRIEWDNNKTINIEKLLDTRKAAKEVASVKLDSIQQILKTVSKAYSCITVLMEDVDDEDSFIGQITAMDKTTVVMHELGPKATMDRGMLMFSINDITRVEAGSIYERSLLRVHGVK